MEFQPALQTSNIKIRLRVGAVVAMGTVIESGRVVEGGSVTEWAGDRVSD